MLANFDYFFKYTFLRVICTNGLAFLGILLVAFGLWGGPSNAVLSAELEKLATFIGSLLTFLGTIATAASIYFYGVKPTRPAPESYWSALIVIVASAIAILCLFKYGSLSSHIVNGFALLGLAGALFRLQPNPQRAASSD